MKRLVKMPLLAVIASGLALAGCGKSEQKSAKVDAKQFIVVSAVDCADNTGLEFDKCVELLQAAINEHDKSATTYTKLPDCEKAEGADRCDRVGERSYRARLSAFQITMTEKPSAVPLYATKKDKPGFRTSSNSEVSVDADVFTFSKSAADAAHRHIGTKKRG